MVSILVAAATLQHLDLSADTSRQVVVDREPGQYLGHVSTLLLEDQKTILCVYPRGHGKGPITLKKSTDGGKTWSNRLPVPENWATSLETPTIHRVIDPKTGAKRLLVWSGLFPARTAISNTDETGFSELKPAGNWGGIVVMGSVLRLKNGDYWAMFHDDGRFFGPNGKVNQVFHLYQTLSHDGGLTWEYPRPIWAGTDIHLCEPGVIRSPDGKEIAVLLRENRRRKSADVIFSRDEAKTWSAPQELSQSLNGDRHTLRYAPDGRLVCVYRDMEEGATKGDFVAWVGRYEDLHKSAAGQYKVRLLDNQDSWDSSYPGLELLKDGTFVATTYGHWTKDQEPYIMSVRFTLAEVDRLSQAKR